MYLRIYEGLREYWQMQIYKPSLNKVHTHSLTHSLSLARSLTHSTHAKSKLWICSYWIKDQNKIKVLAPALISQNQWYYITNLLQFIFYDQN